MFKKLIIVLEFRKTKECDRYYFFSFEYNRRAHYNFLRKTVLNVKKL